MKCHLYDDYCDCCLILAAPQDDCQYERREHKIIKIGGFRLCLSCKEILDEVGFIEPDATKKTFSFVRLYKDGHSEKLKTVRIAGKATEIPYADPPPKGAKLARQDE